MVFHILREEAQLETARSLHPLFYDVCLPNIPTDENGVRFAMVCDLNNTVLAVLMQTLPHKEIVVTSLVLTHIHGLPKLLRFLKHFLQLARPFAHSVQLTPQHTRMLLHNNVSTTEVERLLFPHDK